MAKIKDERIESESNKVYKICFYVLCAAILLDLIIKFALWDFNVPDYIDPNKNGDLIGIKKYTLPFFVVMGLEAVFLVAAFLTNIFVLARKGILFCACDASFEKFPKKRYGLLCLGLGAGISLSFWIIRLIRFGASAYGIWADILFALFIFTATASAVFLLCYLIFYFAYKVAKSKQQNYLIEQTDKK